MGCLWDNVRVTCVLRVQREGALVAVRFGRLQVCRVFFLFVGCLAVAIRAGFVLLWVPCFMPFVAMPGLYCFLRGAQVSVGV